MLLSFFGAVFIFIFLLTRQHPNVAGRAGRAAALQRMRYVLNYLLILFANAARDNPSLHILTRRNSVAKVWRVLCELPCTYGVSLLPCSYVITHIFFLSFRFPAFLSNAPRRTSSHAVNLANISVRSPQAGKQHRRVQAVSSASPAARAHAAPQSLHILSFKAIITQTTCYIFIFAARHVWRCALPTVLSSNAVVLLSFNACCSAFLSLRASPHTRPTRSFSHTFTHSHTASSLDSATF